jgi:hypothetical protein
MPTMPAALLALVLLAATIDPHLAEPLRLLAEVGARDTSDVQVDLSSVNELARIAGADLAVAELPRDRVDRRPAATAETVLQQTEPELWGLAPSR